MNYRIYVYDTSFLEEHFPYYKRALL